MTLEMCPKKKYCSPASGCLYGQNHGLFMYGPYVCVLHSVFSIVFFNHTKDKDSQARNKVNGIYCYLLFSTIYCSWMAKGKTEIVK